MQGVTGEGAAWMWAGIILGLIMLFLLYWILELVWVREKRND